MEQTENPVDVIRNSNKEMIKEMEEMCPAFLKWYEPLGRFGGNLIDASVITKIDNCYNIKIYTELSVISIMVRRPLNGDVHGYLGAQISGRKHCAGFDFSGGRDLADGVYSIETWHRILSDIVSYSLVRLGK